MGVKITGMSLPRLPHGLPSRIVRMGVLAGCVLLGIGILFSPMQHRLQFGTFATTGTPPRIGYCGRRYDPAPAKVTPAQVQADVLLARQGRYERIGTAPSGMAYFAKVADRRDNQGVCTMVIYLLAGPATYVEYTLSGGP